MASSNPGGTKEVRFSGSKDEAPKSIEDLPRDEKVSLFTSLPSIRVTADDGAASTIRQPGHFFKLKDGHWHYIASYELHFTKIGADYLKGNVTAKGAFQRKENARLESGLMAEGKNVIDCLRSYAKTLAMIAIQVSNKSLNLSPNRSAFILPPLSGEATSGLDEKEVELCRLARAGFYAFQTSQLNVSPADYFGKNNIDQKALNSINLCVYPITGIKIIRKGKEEEFANLKSSLDTAYEAVEARDEDRESKIQAVENELTNLILGLCSKRNYQVTYENGTTAVKTNVSIRDEALKEVLEIMWLISLMTDIKVPEDFSSLGKTTEDFRRASSNLTRDFTIPLAEVNVKSRNAFIERHNEEVGNVLNNGYSSFGVDAF